MLLDAGFEVKVPSLIRLRGVARYIVMSVRAIR